MRQRHINLLSGASPIIRESARWLRAIEESASAEGASLFVAADVRGPEGAPPAICVPSGFDGCRMLDEGFQGLIFKYKPIMAKILASSGWPAHVSSSVCPVDGVADRNNIARQKL